MKFKRFEDIKVWQDSRKLVNKVYRLINSNPSIRKDFSLADQLKRASYSVLLNIAEGFERRSKREFANFLNIAKGSAGEVRSILYVVKDNYSIGDDTFSALMIEIENISSQLHKFRNFLLNS